MKKWFVMLLAALLLCTGAALAEDTLVLDLSFEGNVTDSCGNPVTANKDATYVEGVNGQALYFDGATYLDLGTSGTLQPAAMTFSAWVKADQLWGENIIAWFKPSGNYQGEGWYLSCLDDWTPLKLSVGASFGQPMECFVSATRSEFFPANEWVHIAVTYDSAAQVCEIYRNGVKQDVIVINEKNVINADETSGKWLGFNSPGYGAGYAVMAMDEIKLYSEVKSAEEIAALYTAYGAELPAEALAAEEAAEVVAEELPDDALALSLSFENAVTDACGNPVTANKDATYVEGVNGQALYFDGATYLDLGTSGTLQPAAMTFSAWVKADQLWGENIIAWFKPSGNYQGEGWYLSCLDDWTPLKLSVGASFGQPMECYVAATRSEFFPANEWVHIAVTYDSATQTCCIYRNGEAQSVIVINEKSVINTDETSSKWLGFNSPGYNGGYAVMAMDEIALYSEALTAGQVLTLYSQFSK